MCVRARERCIKLVNLPSIGGFQPLANTMMIPFMELQTLAMARAFGINYEAGKRMVRAMSNDEFNNHMKTGFDDFDKIQNITVQKSLQEIFSPENIEYFRDLQRQIYLEYVEFEKIKVQANIQLLKELPPEYLQIFAGAITNPDITAAVRQGEQSIGKGISEDLAAIFGSLRDSIENIGGGRTVEDARSRKEITRHSTKVPTEIKMPSEIQKQQPRQQKAAATKKPLGPNELEYSFTTMSGNRITQRISKRNAEIAVPKLRAEHEANMILLNQAPKGTRKDLERTIVEIKERIRAITVAYHQKYGVWI